MLERNGIRVSFAFSFLSLFLFFSFFSEIVEIWLSFFSLTVASYVASEITKLRCISFV